MSEPRSREWERLPLGELLESMRNGTNSIQNDGPTEYPVTRIETISNGKIDLNRVGYLRSDEPEYKMRKGDILYSHINSVSHIGKVAMYDGDEPLFHGMNLMLLRPDRARVDPAFLFANLASDRGRVHARRECKSAINQASLSKADIARLLIELPPLQVQRVIVAILDTLDKAIEQTEALIAKMLQIRTGLMHDLFTRGLLPNGELRPPREEAPQLYKESPPGWIPKEWVDASLAELVPHATYGISEALDDIGRVPVLRMNNLREGEAELSDLKYCSKPISNSLFLRQGDVLFNRTNSIDHVGRTGIWRGQLQPASFASYLVRLEPNPERLRNEFLNLWLNWDVTQRKIRQFATPGVHQVNINPRNLRRSRIALPFSLAEQDRVVNAIHANRTSLSWSLGHVAMLEELKSGLMDDLLTGRVRIPESMLKRAAAAT